MVGIALGIAIAVVAGVYGWQQYESTKPVAVPPTTVVSTTPPPAASKPPAEKPKPVDLPASKPGAVPPTAPPAGPPKPFPSGPPSSQVDNKVPAGPSSTAGPAAKPAPGAPSASPPSTAQTPGEDTPIAVPETPNVATPEKLEQLIVGMTEDDVQQTMGKEGVPTPEDQLAAYTPEGWYEVRWPNADGSYIAALFNDLGRLAHLEPFNMPGASEWKATPWYAVPSWLNDKLRSSTMPVRLPAVDIVEAQADTFQFRGVLANADGQVLGSISGTYYVNDPSGRFVRAMEGTYEYTLPDGTVDANTFQFSE